MVSSETLLCLPLSYPGKAHFSSVTSNGTMSSGSNHSAASATSTMMSYDSPQIDCNSTALLRSDVKASYYESLAWRLGHFDFLLDALQELRSEFFINEYRIPDDEFRSSASRIMNLLEVAKCTLEEIGVNLWLHSLCVVGLRKHKKAYFALLKLLRSRADCLDSQLQARSLRLTCRLSTNFSIHVDPVFDFYISPNPRRPKRGISGQLNPQLKSLCKTMPPPNAFPPSNFIPISSRSVAVQQRCFGQRMRLPISNDLLKSLGLVEQRAASPKYHGSLGSRRPGSGGIMKRSSGNFYTPGKSGSISGGDLKRVPAGMAYARPWKSMLLS
ncbi:hypothetical protein BDP27DRAFT_1317053 [Rhodocollybia butyracea]|uniref:Uncharacterized protein n=1 Tax=Rhodocollybia butyracea TaxID=206335 RepID=A0A9P5Q510_9AGAR|nr:hypothetical protein BDP27DRAFT_1317053 [Rhodocollybia butyracea]